MSKLDDILKSHADYFAEGDLPDQLLKTQLKALMLELVGEDELRPTSGAQRNGTAQAVRRAGNKVKAELRQKIEAL